MSRSYVPPVNQIFNTSLFGASSGAKGLKGSGALQLVAEDARIKKAVIELGKDLIKLDRKVER